VVQGKVEGSIWSGPPGDLIAAAAQLIDNEAEFEKLFIQVQHKFLLVPFAWISLLAHHDRAETGRPEEEKEEREGGYGHCAVARWQESYERRYRPR
jgi:hypothetical protein